MALTKSRSGRGLGVSREIANSMPNRNVRMRIRTLTSQASQSRSSNMDCMPNPNFRALSVGSAVALTRAIRTLASRPLTGRRASAADSSSRVSRSDVSLASHLGDQREQRHVQRNYDAANRNTKERDQIWLQHGQHVFGRG